MDVKTLCLGVLSRGAASGYEIKKQCEEGPFAHFYAAGFGSIYPALNSLLNDRLISLEEVSQTGRPAKKIYSITASGRQALTDEMLQEPAPDRLRSDFLFIMFFGQMLSARDIDTLIENRITLFRQRLAEMYQCREEPMPEGEKFALGYGIAIYEAGAEYLDNHQHELVGAALRNETGDAEIPPSSRNSSEVSA
ncbi:MAG: PadR family transcriptional regulator [Alphaproteobacteria bacterium]